MEDRFQKANDGAYNNLLVVALAVIGIYLFISGFNKSKKQTYLDTAGTDVNTQQAQALRDAMNRSGVAIMMSVDGTDVDLIMQTAQQITDYTSVADSYRTIYGSELTVDLQEELSRTDLQKFYDIIYKRNSNPTSTTTATAGKRVQANQTVNIREVDDPSKVHHQAAKGDVLGNFVGEATLKVSGTSSRFILFETDGYFGFFKSRYYVLKTAVNLV